MKSQNILKDKSYIFAIRSVKFYKFLKDEKKEFIFIKTSFENWNFYWCNGGRSFAWINKMDFIHKLSIANKEANETRYWNKIIERYRFY